MTATRRPTNKPAKAGASKNARSSTRTTGQGRRAARPARPGLIATLRNRLAGHGAAVWATVLLALAVVGALGVYTELAGPAGHGVKVAAGDLAGWGRLVLPVVLGLVGWALVRADTRGQVPRLVIGSVIATVGLAGLLQDLNGPAHWPKKVATLRSAGGFIGFGVGQPLHAAAGAWGAALVLSAVVVIGALVLTATPLRQVVQAIETAAGGIGRAALATGRSIADLGRRDEDADDYDERDGGARNFGGGLFDQDEGIPSGRQEGQDAPAPKSRRRKAESEAAPAASAVAVAPRAPVSITLPPPPEQLDPEALEAARPNTADGTWKLPPLSLLKRTEAAEIDHRLIEAKGRALEDALAAHGVETHLVGMTVGPTVTRYELELGAGVKVARVLSLQKDIAYAMAAVDVRILAPIPGRSAIGVEVPNAQRQLVAVGDILTSAEAREATHPLEVAMGRDIAGRAVMANLAQMPHILVAGATGAGKSSCINSLLTSLLVRATPDQVRLILVDPKRVELGQYNGLPHLLTQVVTNPKKAANALAWAVHEMERRYDLLAEVGVRDVTGYNDAFDRGDFNVEPELGAEPREADSPKFARLPFILIVIDELNDLMMVAARDVEESIVRIAQMARAVGIHLVIATQRPSVDVITGVIKANVPSRLAFAVSSLADSRVILDQPGAERLIGKGDMLLLTASSSVARRVQGAWVDEDEVRKVVAHWRRQSEPRYVEGVEGSEDGGSGSAGGGLGDDSDDDDLLAQARELVVRSQLGSTSMLQRKLRVGFARAGRIMDLLEQRGIVGPSEGSKARTVLMTVEELEGGAEGQ
jgi:DNA segregation ATPase FtsK/SpoIIIE, S-DNA-T family